MCFFSIKRKLQQLFNSIKTTVNITHFTSKRYFLHNYTLKMEVTFYKSLISKG